MAGTQDIPKRPPKCLGEQNLDCFVRFPGVPGSPRVGSQKVHRGSEMVREGWRRLGEGWRRTEKLREGQRRSEKVRESVRKCEEV